MKKLDKIGFYTALYGVVIVLVWIGAFKFTPTEAKAIKPLVMSSPLMSWMYNVLSEMGVSKLIGITEIGTGILLGSYTWFKKASFVGGILTSITFLVTLSFIFTTPNLITQIDGFWVVDAFILKDIMGLGIGLWITAKSWETIQTKSSEYPFISKLVA
ncbi:hypothetical protein AD998_09000 [bacterium 336/3]|nr:hypothetical protein AD998_09000 [bacterium 336/3]